MKTERLYYFSDALTARAKVLKLEPDGEGGSIILDRTIFVPQGGGQPADAGSIGGVIVTQVKASKDIPGAIVHTAASLEGLSEETEVELHVDDVRRQRHSRLHTGGHLIAALIEELLPEAKACGGHHWPGEGRVEFLFGGILADRFESSVTAAIANAIRSDLPIRRTLAADGERYVQIGNYPPLRCGGTHCQSLGYLGHLAIRGINQKKDRLRIGYHVADPQLATHSNLNEG